MHMMNIRRIRTSRAIRLASTLAILLATFSMTAVAAAESDSTLQFKAPEVPVALQFSPGMYRCELNRNVHVRHVSDDGQMATLVWNRKEYTLRSAASRTGALRYEDPVSGLVWLVIVGKSMLLDSRAGRQLANECRR
jgi:Membrane-bound lysozyme-inhibitor of c-type lysozyme